MFFRIQKMGKYKYLQICKHIKKQGKKDYKKTIGSLGNIDKLSIEEIESLIKSAEKILPKVKEEKSKQKNKNKKRPS